MMQLKRVDPCGNIDKKTCLVIESNQGKHISKFHIKKVG